MMSPYASPIARAPLAIVIVGNEKRFRFGENWEQDMGAATENLLLEAVEQGLGAVWLGVHPLEERKQIIAEMLKLPENIIPFAAVAVGYPSEEEANRFVDRFDAGRIHEEMY